uniref:Uncharacterized protein n=1 Tax=Oryzias melastigma TaxID=30732 RepID=A0A3B3D0R0_ORYME
MRVGAGGKQSEWRTKHKIRPGRDQISDAVSLFSLPRALVPSHSRSSSTPREWSGLISPTSRSALWVWRGTGCDWGPALMEELCSIVT